MNVKNKVLLLDYCGGDKRFCLSAWQSTNVDFSNPPESIKDRIDALFDATVGTKKKTPEELIKMLADEEHCTPFEKSLLDFQVSADVASHIHSVKHRIAVSINAESSRWKELEDKWYVPEDWKKIHVDNDINNPTWYEVLEMHSRTGHELYHTALKDISPVLGRKRAKETARYFHGYNKVIDYDMCFNFRSFAHFQLLRRTEKAQDEIHAIADEMLRQVWEIPNKPFRYTLEAFGLTPGGFTII